MSPRRGSTYALTTEPYDGWVKIGRCGPDADPRERLTSCQTGNARPLRLRAAWPADVELEFHRLYHAFRGQGEWFALPMPMIRRMAALAKKPKPWEQLFSVWSPAVVDPGTAVVSTGEDGRPEALARVFMNQEAAWKAIKEKSKRPGERIYHYHPKPWEYDLLADGADTIEITYVGEILSCAVLGKLIHLGRNSGFSGV